jgi:hypothetical protein
MSAPSPRPPLVTWLYNHNPFYAISAVLMLFAVRSGYGELEIGAINCWIMMGILAGYTALLAGIGVLIVRWGQVWEDARSILLLLLILFLAVSISADDLFVNMESSAGGTLLMLCGYVFSAVVTELVLRGTGVRLGWWYRLPLHLFLLLFFVAPWWCSPELHPREIEELEWTIFAFPVVAAVLLLGLLPAVRRGPAYADENGSPWRWPWFPWTAFGVIIAAIGLRTFVLCMTFGPTGPIWVNLSSGAKAIAFDTMWGPYFLIPPAWAVLVLILEGGLATRNAALLQRVLRSAPLLLVLAIPLSHGAVFRGFLNQFTETLGSPLWLAVWGLLGFYLWAGIRGVAGAGMGTLASFSLLSVIGPGSLDLRTMTEPQAWPLLSVGGLLLARGVYERSSKICLGACIVLTAAAWLWLPETPLASWRATVCLHLLWCAALVLGLWLRDPLADLLRNLSALLMPLAALDVVLHPDPELMPVSWRVAYLSLLTVASLVIAGGWRNRWFLYAFLALLTIDGYAGAAVLFRGAIAIVGRKAMTALAWSVGSLLIAVLISAHKARWLPPRLFPRWANGSPPADAPLAESPSAPPSHPGEPA